MNTDELKDHQIAVCTALVNGNPVQVLKNDGLWSKPSSAGEAASWLFDHELVHRVRLQPPQRKCWVGWDRSGHPWCSSDEKEKAFNTVNNGVTDWVEVNSKESQ